MNEEEEIIDLAPDQIEKETYNELIQHENTLVYPIIIGSNIKGGTVKNVTINETSTIGGVSGSTIANIGAISADITPTGLSVDSTGITISDDGTVSAYVVLSWNAINTSTFDRYRIRYKKGTFTYYQYISTNETTILIDGLTPNTSYNFGIASVNKYGTLSAFSSDIASTTATSTVPPVTVVGVSAVSGIQYAIVEWAANSEKDIAHYNIYRNTVNNPATATLVASIKGTYLLDGNLTGGQIYYYWLKAVNTSGLLSTNFSTAASTTPRDTGLGDISEGAALAMFGWTQSCVFSTDGRTKVNWTSGTLKTAGNKTYNITAGTTGIMTAKTYIYLDINVSTTTYQITTTATNTVGLGKLLVATAENVAEADGSEASFRVIDGDMKLVDALVANSIKASHISAGAITTTELNFTPVQDINVIASINASAEGVDISASKIATLSAEKILIDGDVYLSNWRSATDMTKIDGGNIYTGTVTTTQLSFTPVQNTDVIAKINASEEGIRIDADNIEISGSTTFASGYDPTGRVLAVGGSYDTASSGARVRIFPDSNTGIQIIDDSSKDVFKAMIGGDNVGDVIIGDYSGGQGIFYDKSENKTTFAGVLSAAAGTLGEITAGTLTGTVVRTGTTGERIIFNFSDTPVGGSAFTKALVSKDKDNRYSRIIHARGQEDVALFRPLTPGIETDNLYYIKDRRIDSAVASSDSAAINIWSQPIHTDGQARNHSGRAITAYSVYPLVFGYATKNTSGTLDISGHWHISDAVQPPDNQAYWNGNITGYDFVGYNLGSSPKNYKIEIDGTGSPNTFKWSDDGGSNWNNTGVNVIKGSSSGSGIGWFGYLESDDGSMVQVYFNDITGGVVGDYWEFTTGATDTSSVGFFGQKRTNSDSSVLGLTQASKTSTHFQKFIWLGGTYIYRSDGTTPNGNLDGTTGDVCLNCDGGKAYYCTNGTNWTAM